MSLLFQPSNPRETALGKLEREKKTDYWGVHKWSIENPDEFWSRAWDDLDLIGNKGDHAYQAADRFIDAKFFPHAKINVAENLLANGDGVAIVGILEDGTRSELTYAQLREKSAAVAAAMRQMGIVAGDRVVAWAPNVPEVMIYALGALSIGAIVSTASPDFAPSAVEDRFGQVAPKLILLSDSYQYGGKTFDLKEKSAEIIALLPTLEKSVQISEFESWIAPFMGAGLEFNRLPFDHPGFVLFSSGTTGKPKCITHSGAGVMLKAGAEQLYQFDMKPGEKVFFFTTCGWMMWNWLFMCLVRNVTIVLFDGSPVFPLASRLFDIAQDEQLNFFGVSAKFIDGIKKVGLEPAKTHDLSNLRMIGSTGSVLVPEGFDYIYEHVKKDVHLASMSGGTDICGCFVASIPTLGVHRGELQGPCLGMATTVFNAQGRPAKIDEKGELVCTLPFPSKPIGFWGDKNNEKYLAAYFEGFPGVWTHGDFASVSSTGGFTLYGRSDATLNSKGVRIGTAEIYRVVETFPQVQECMAVSQEWDNDTRVVLFVVVKEGQIFNEEVAKEIKKVLKDQASPRHVPDKIIVAPELPRTKSNKLVELAVTDVINGREVRNRDALANPNALDWFKNLPELLK
ncbi:MAG: acetoacetate--CoA ligase [Candidatus Nanopelagicaceae bacterium]